MRLSSALFLPFLLAFAQARPLGASVTTCEVCTGGVCCDPSVQPLEYCPGAIPCCDCGTNACQCPSSTPTPPPPTPQPPAPTPQPQPSPGPVPTSPSRSDTCSRQGQSLGLPLSDQKAVAASFWQYQWGPAPYGTQGDIAGVLQIVNGGSEPMWIRFSGNGIMPGQQYEWKPFITNASALNGKTAHMYTALNSYNLTGQGDGFYLGPGEYQIVPFTSSACWLGGTLGCCKHGGGCQVSPNGRGGGTDASGGGQPNTLFEWTAPGVWDASLVDGFSLPMKVEVDGCGPPGTGSRGDCNGNQPLTYLNFQESLCPNRIEDSQGHFLGCKSMCGCQNRALALGQDTDPACPGMEDVSNIANKPNPPGGYCGCPQGECVQALRDLFDRDAAGKAYCDAVTTMAHDDDGLRAVYCQAYDDNAGTRSYGNGVIKVTLCNNGYQWATDRSKQC